MTRIALALGGGGARGLAHIPLLEVFDELGIKPHRLAGASLGAMIAAMYASGMSGAAIHEAFAAMLISRKDRIRDIFGRPDLRRWLDIVQLNVGRGGLIKGDSFRAFLGEGAVAPDFADLEIPLKVVTADFWSWEQVVLDSGDLPHAVQASMSVPGVFLPVELGGRVLVDGGMVNPVPYDLWNEDCDVRIAFDVSGRRGMRKSRIPGIFESVFNSFQIMQRAIVEAKIEHDPPELLIRPAIHHVRMFEFHKIEEIYHSAEKAKQRLKRELESILERAEA